MRARHVATVMFKRPQKAGGKTTFCDFQNICAETCLMRNATLKVRSLAAGPPLIHCVLLGIRQRIQRLKTSAPSGLEHFQCELHEMHHFGIISGFV